MGACSAGFERRAACAALRPQAQAQFPAVVAGADHTLARAIAAQVACMPAMPAVPAGLGLPIGLVRPSSAHELRKQAQLSSAQLVYTTRPRSLQKGNRMGGMGTAQNHEHQVHI